MCIYELRSDTPEQTRAFGRHLAQCLPKGSFVALIGELGAGKTELVRGFAAGLGIDPAVVRSPTFPIHVRYGEGLLLDHLDAYRLSGPDELADSGALDTIDEQGYVLVEWADRVADILPPSTLRVFFSHVAPQRRALEIRGSFSSETREKLERFGGLRCLRSR